MSDFKVLYDGWALAYQPYGPEAIHLHTLFDYSPHELQHVVALPAKPIDKLPEQVMAQVIDAPPTARAHLIWEQCTLNRWTKKAGIDLIHLISGGPALFGRSLSVISPAGIGFPEIFPDLEDSMEPPPRYGGLAGRLRLALVPAGLQRASAMIWPADLPEPKVGIPLFRLPPMVPTVFWDENLPSIDLADVELPESYILCHGPTTENELRRVMDAWSWASAPLGEDTTLLLLGLDQAGKVQLAHLVGEYKLGNAVRVLPEVSLAGLAGVYKRCSALFHITPISPWGDPTRLALACGKPVVGLENPISDALVGPAAYLVRAGNSQKATARALGAALVTVMADESVAESLAEEAKKRSAAWRAAESQFRDGVSGIYQRVTYR
jgi:glycosyltransferase involved in cell wall biosynthesis